MARSSPHEAVTSLGTALLRAVGAPADEARRTAQELVTSSLMGCDSHGVLRIPEYLDLVARGAIVPGASLSVEQENGAAARVDCGRNFGAVGAQFALETGKRLVQRHRVACVTTLRCSHVGRLGACVEAAAACDLIALASCNSPIYGHFVLPWGGERGRLATNPLAYAVPTGADPIVADFSTSVVPEGKLRYYKNMGLPVPPGWILDAEGRPATDPAQFYGPPLGGILPLGGAAGHKGFALGLLVEILGTALAGIATTDETVVGNGLSLVLIDPAAFGPLEQFKGHMDATVAYVKSSPPAPGFEEVLMPGEREFRTLRQRQQTGLPIDEVTWRAIEEHGRRLHVPVEI